MTNVGFVREHNLQNGDVSDDRRRDGGDEEEDGRQEDEDHADPIPANEVSCACATNDPRWRTDQWNMRAIVWSAVCGVLCKPFHSKTAIQVDCGSGHGRL